MNPMEQELRRQSLEEYRRGGLVVDVVGQRHEKAGIHGAHPGIGPDRFAGIDDTVAAPDVGDARPDIHDDRGRFHPGDAGRRQQRQVSGAAIDVDEVDADRRLAKARLAGTGRHDPDGRHRHDLGSAIAFDNDAGALALTGRRADFHTAPAR